jgi:integrase
MPVRIGCRTGGRKPFLTGRAKSLDTTIDLWRRHLSKVFALADVGTEPATPHRFRHTFARILLQRGVPVPDVADLLGIDERDRAEALRALGARAAGATHQNPGRRIQR